ncbi:MAG: hypothetical protein LH618_08605, partial [Saprospiraceae bacterium]|nr:hypothetical protein [Saprospiraceae bacterium]
FQDDLPVRWSEVRVSVPETFNYSLLMRVPRPLDVQETSPEYTRYAFRNLPAIRSEPFVTTLDDYRAHIGFQLASVTFPGKTEQKFMTTWEDLAKEMEKWDGFGQQYKREKNSDDMWQRLSLQLAPGMAADSIAQQVLRFVGNNLKWNGELGYILEGSLDDAFQRKTGSSAALNLALVALLRRAGLDAVPMLVSTRNNGKTYEKSPFREQFNSVVAYLRQGDSGLLLDATNPFLPVGQLDVRYYNGAGWLVDSKQPVWITLKPPEALQTWFGQLRLAESGELSGKFTINVTGAIAADWRGELTHTSEQDFLKKHFAPGYPDITFDSIHFAARQNFYKPLQVSFQCRIPNAANIVNDFIYCRLVLDYLVEENPFKSLNRSFPVNFAYPVKMNYALNLQLPLGYVVEELPQAARIALADDTGKISFNCSNASPQMVQLQFRMNLSKAEFAAEDYGALRKFFGLIAEKTQLQLVLKRG